MKRVINDDEEVHAKQAKLSSEHVAEHYNKIPEVGLKIRSESRIYYLRNFNNWIKSVLLNECIQSLQNRQNIVALDLGCGKGGDLLKWSNGRIAHLVAVDLAETSILQCRDRYKEMQQRRHRHRFTADIFSLDCSRNSIHSYINEHISFSISSCQFAIHYSFETLKQAECMIANAVSHLQPGCLFVCTTVDSVELVARLLSTKGFSFGNSIYHVEFPSSDKKHFPIFGCQYKFSLDGVVDLPEYLVHLPVLESLLARHRVRLVSKRSFSQIFNEHAKTSARLLRIIKALEVYPPHQGNSLHFGEVDYGAARDFIRNEMSTNPSVYGKKIQVGTIAQSEWDMISLYTACVFEKVHNHEEFNYNTDLNTYDPDKLIAEANERIKSSKELPPVFQAFCEERTR